MFGRKWKAHSAAVFIGVVLIASGAFGQSAAELSRSLEATTRVVSPAVVEIFTTSYLVGDGLVPATADLVTTQRASGSGVIVDPDGYIVTNAHVVNGAQRLRVEFSLPTVTGRSILATTSRTVAAQIVGVDIETDLAIIKIDQKNLPVLSFADSDDLKTGQIVLAFGSPMGFRNSVSLGVISSTARQLEPESPMIYVQTDASINPGSSGGPLVDLQGRVVGINTLLFSQAGGDEGLGFAAPSNIVRSVYEQIRKDGRVRRGDIGVRTQTVTPVMASGLKLEREYGVVVSDVVPGSAAARVGLTPGDLILTLDGKAMENGRQFQVGLYRRRVGDLVELEVLRDGKVLEIPIAISERRDTLADIQLSADPHEHLLPRLGILGVNLDRRIAEKMPYVRGWAGVVVASTVDGAIDAREGGLAPGDIIHALNRTTVRGLAELRAMLNDLKSGDPVVLQLERHGELKYLAFTAE